jgi:putative ABC transport system permease protein
MLLAFRNLCRRPLRTGLTVSGVALSIAVLYSLVSFQSGYQLRLRAELEGLGAHILVVPKGCPYEAASIAVHGANWPRYLQESELAALAAAPGVRHLAGVLMSATTDPRTARQQIYLGVDDAIRAVKPFWQIQGRFPARSEDALVGSEVARRLHLAPGRCFASEAGGQRFRVSGVIARTGGQDDSFIYIPRRTAQRLFRHPGQITNMLVIVNDPEKVLQVAAALRRRDPDANVVPMAQVLGTLLNLARTTRLLVACVVLIALLISAFGVVNTIVSSVFERTGEIGMLRAVGASRIDIFRLVWLETLFVCMAGGAAGCGLALLGARLVEAIVRGQLPYAPRGTLIAPDAWVFAGCMAGAAALGALAGLLPAVRACALRPVEAIRGRI